MAKKTLKLMQLVWEAKREFPVNWLETIDVDNDFSEAIERIENFAQKAFVFFAKSILSGEYIIRDDIMFTLAGSYMKTQSQQQLSCSHLPG